MSIKVDELVDIINKKGSYSKVKEQLSSPKLPEQVKEFKPDFELDDDGEEYMSVGVNGLLAASEKLLAMNRGLAEQDERDSLRYQKIVRPADMFRERIKMDSGKLARQMMYQASKRKNLSGMLPNAFNGYIDAVMKGNPLTSPLEEINPMQLVENSRRISKMGPGGIPSADSITEETQAVHPSQFGFIDPIAGPECIVDGYISNGEVHDAGYFALILTDSGFIRIRDLTVEHKVLCRNNDGRLSFEHPSRVVHEEYKGELYELDGSSWDDRATAPCMIVTPTHRVVTVEEDSSTWLFKPASECVDKKIGIPTLAGDIEQFGATDWTIHKNCSCMVHCCTVPGGMFCISVGGCIPFWTGNSEKAGVDVRAAWGTKVGSNGRIYQKFYDKKNKCFRWMNAGEIANLTVKIPD